ncbi:MAG: HlyD family efflux transporter periplasmic adaptor subunit [Woeseia sp.]
MRTLFLLLGALALGGCGGQQDNAIVGQLASDRIELTAQFAEPVIARHVAEGAAVNKDQLLLEQDAARLAARLREAAAAVAQQQARIDELTRGPRREQIDAARSAVSGARRDVEFLQLEYRRARDIFDRKLAAAESVDRARAALDDAKAQLAVKEAQLAELLTGTTIEEMRQAEAQLEILRARQQQAELDRQRLNSSSPVDGTLDSWLIELGERPQPGQPLAIVLAGGQPYARVYVPEEMRVAVVPGTTADILVDGRATPLTGKVRWVSAEAAFTPFFALTEHDRGRLTYVAKIDIDYVGERLPDGVPVTVHFAGVERTGP